MQFDFYVVLGINTVVFCGHPAGGESVGMFSRCENVAGFDLNILNSQWYSVSSCSPVAALAIAGSGVDEGFTEGGYLCSIWYS